MQAQRLLDKVWQWLGEDKRLSEAVAALWIVQLLIVFLPQAPVSSLASPGYSRWLAEQRSVLKDWTAPLSTLGLLTLRTSIWMRGLLILLVWIIVTRAADAVERWRGLSRSRRRLQVLSWVGGMLIVAGWGAQTLWGWKQSDVMVWPEESIVIADAGLTLPPPHGAMTLLTEHYGLYLVPKGNSVGLVVRAVNEQGEVLLLSPSARADPQEQLRLVLTDEMPEAYFALPQIGFVFRLSRPRQNDAPLQVQVYHSADGELLVETALQGDGTLFADTVRVQFNRYALKQYEAVYNPGALLEGLGMLALSSAVLGTYLFCRQAPPPAGKKGAGGMGL
ncbi:MAG TPA: hypothetical protein PLH19_02295 [Anaerolineae bacterium]|nr:hypothetical protein [Anaerolineae bacterium]HQH37354.1 hypothetical protein [Anaerolineae bacterium]